MDNLREKVIRGLTELKLTAEVDNRAINGYPTAELCTDALSLLETQELPPVKPEKLEEVTTKWLDEMTAKERLEKIAMIIDDWDGYRTAKGLAGLINEVWAYALYPVKEQDSVKPKVDIDTYVCGACGTRLERQSLIGPNAVLAETFNYCPNCGRKVKWDD